MRALARIRSRFRCAPRRHTPALAGEVVIRSVCQKPEPGSDFRTPACYRYSSDASSRTQRGASEGVAHDMVEMITAQNAGIYNADQGAATPTPTSFRTWCDEVLRRAVVR